MKQQKYIPLLFLAWLIAGCSNEDASEKTMAGEAAQVRFDVNVESTQTITRGTFVQGTSFFHGSSINVILAKMGGTDGAMTNEMTYAFNDPTGIGGVWIPGSDPGLSLDEKAMGKVYAHYPAMLSDGSVLDRAALTLAVNMPDTKAFGKAENYDSGNSVFVRFKYNEDEQEVLLADNETADYMAGTGNDVTYTALSSKIKMKHLLSLVVIKAYKAPDNITPGQIKEMSFTNKYRGNPLHRGVFSLADNHFVNDATTELSYKLTMGGFPMGMYYGFLVYPVSMGDNDVNLTIKVDQAEYTLTLPTQQWEAGKILLYNLKLNATSVELDQTVNVVDWGNIIDHPFNLD